MYYLLRIFESVRNSIRLLASLSVIRSTMATETLSDDGLRSHEESMIDELLCHREVRVALVDIFRTEEREDVTECQTGSPETIKYV